jgi:GNAT superfamily N-acetyltransferase
VSDRSEGNDELASRAVGWVHGMHTAVCDVIEPWEHGTVVRATRYPTYFDYNAVRVEQDPGMSLDELAAFADEKLAGLGHRRIDFDFARAADRLRPEFETEGWKPTRLIYLRHSGSTPPAERIPVERVRYDEVIDLRVSWENEEPDLSTLDMTGHRADARAVAMSRDAEVVAVREGSTPIAYAQIERAAGSAELSQLYVLPEHRGRGLGTSLTLACIEAARGVRELWICADDEDRPKELYKRLGFEPAATMLQLLRLM